MKKFLSISFAFFILLSGMHFSIATHRCGGEIAAVKLSFSGKNATCGMEQHDQKLPARKSITSECCHNEIAVYAVDKNYNPSTFQRIEISKLTLQLFNAFVNIPSYSISSSNHLFTYISPHDKLLTSAVSLADICVFRI
jgi:hypothetical protein